MAKLFLELSRLLQHTSLPIVDAIEAKSEVTVANRIGQELARKIMIDSERLGALGWADTTTLTATKKKKIKLSSFLFSCCWSIEFSRVQRLIF